MVADMGELKWKAGAVLCAATLGWLLPLPGGASAAAGVQITFVGRLETTEAGGVATFAIELAEAPVAAVSISLASTDTTEGVVSPDLVVFDATSWNVPVTITVTGVDDVEDDGDQQYSIVSPGATSDDPAYNGLSLPLITITNLDDEDTPGFAISPSTELTVVESGTTDTYTVALTAQPIADVVITHTSSDTTEGTVTPPTSVFTAANWNVPQTVTITGVNDTIDDGDVEFQILQTAASADPRYEALAVPSVAAVTLDNETPAVLIVPTSDPITTEVGGGATYRVQLSSRPSVNVAVALTSGNPSEGTPSVGEVRFTRTTWNVPQTVTITGVDDAIDDGDVAYAIRHAVVTADQRYRSVTVDDVQFTNLDDDSAGVRFTPSFGLRTREGSSTQYTAVLLSEPTAPVTVTHGSSNTEEGRVAPGGTTFDPTNWNIPQAVTITGVSDGIADGEETFFVEHLVTSADAVYAALSIPRQRVVVADDGIGATTTTTTRATTTTTAPTTTEAVTTTVAPTTSTTTTTTTTLAESLGLDSSTSTTVVLRTNSNLPTAGSNVGHLAVAAACATGTGVIVQLLTRRRSLRES